MFSAIAIDFDGVLVDSQPLHQAAWRTVLRGHAFEPPDLAGRILGRSAIEFARSLRLPEAQAVQLAHVKERLVSQLASTDPPLLYPTVEAALPALANRYRLAVVSSADPELIHAVLSAYRLERYFETVVTGPKHATPDSPYMACLAHFSLPGRAVVAVEDTPQGIAAARAAGLTVVAISNTLPADSLHAADIVVSEFSALSAAIEALNVAA